MGTRVRLTNTLDVRARRESVARRPTRESSTAREMSASSYGAAPVDAERGARDVDGSDESDGSNTRRGTWRRAGAFVAFAVVVVGAVASARSWTLGRRRMVNARFSVDIGCITKDAIDAHWPEFFESDVVGAEVLFRGTPPREFGGSNRVGGVPLVQDGFSSIFTKVIPVKPGEEYGFVLVNAAGQRMFEFGHSRHFHHIHRPVLAEGTCVDKVRAGGGVYTHRRIPRRMSEITLNADGEYLAAGTWGSCVGTKCPVTVKLIATVSGSGDNVYGIEESKALNERWIKYKGHFTIVTAGVENTWGLDTATNQLAWTRNADLNPYSAANWNVVTNAAGSSGAVVDFDAGYDVVMGVTSDDKVWQRPSSGANSWTPAGYSGSRLIQTTVGRTNLWGVNSAHRLYWSRLPMDANSHWTQETSLGTSVKQVEVGDADAFVVLTDNKTLKRKREDGGGGAGGFTTILTPSTLPAGLVGIDSVAVGETGLWILATDGALFSCRLPCNGPAEVSLVPDAPENIISVDAGKVPHP